MPNSSLITGDARQWIIDETTRLGNDISVFGSNITTFGSNFQGQLGAFVAFQNSLRNSFYSAYSSLINDFWVNGTNALYAHTSMRFGEVHGITEFTQTYLDANHVVVGIKVLEMTTTGGTLYSPCSLSPNTPI